MTGEFHRQRCLGLQSIGLQRVGHGGSNLTHASRWEVWYGVILFSSLSFSGSFKSFSVLQGAESFLQKQSLYLKKKPENIIFNYLDVEGTHGGAKSFSFCCFVFPPSFPWGTLFGNLFLISGFPGGSDGKESACSAGDLGLIPGLWRSPGEGNGYPL